MKPTKPGFYWGIWRIKDEGTDDYNESTGNEWEVHHVAENSLDKNSPEHLMVMVPGVRKWQSLENFYWGEEVTRDAPSSPAPPSLAVGEAVKNLREDIQRLQHYSFHTDLVKDMADKMLVMFDTIQAAQSPQGCGWQDISTAPRDGTEIIILTAGGSVFKAKYEPYSSVNDKDEECGQWWATTEAYPKCWSESGCWGSNEEELPSDPPLKWMPSPAIDIAPKDSPSSNPS